MQSPLSAVPVRRVAQIMGVTGRSNQIPGRQPLADFLVLRILFAESFDDTFTNLRRFNGVGKACPVKIAFPDSHDLGLGLKPAKCRRVDNPGFVS